MQPSTAGRYWERDVVIKLVCQVRPIDALWGQIRAVWWPVKRNHIVLGEKVAANSSNMRPGIILLECQIVSLHKRNRVLTEHSVSELNCV